MASSCWLSQGGFEEAHGRLSLTEWSTIPSFGARAFVEPVHKAPIDFVISGRRISPFEVLTHQIDPCVEQIEGGSEGFRDLVGCRHSCCVADVGARAHVRVCAVPATNQVATQEYRGLRPVAHLVLLDLVPGGDSKPSKLGLIVPRRVRR